MTFLYDTYNHLKTDIYTVSLLGFSIFCNIIATLICSETLVYISNGNMELIPYYLTLITIPTIISNFIINPFTLKIASNIQTNFTSNSIIVFAQKNETRKTNVSSYLYWENYNNGGNALFRMVDWGIHHVFSLIGIFLDVTWTFYQKNILTEFIYILIASSLLYYLFIKKIQREYNILDKRKKNENMTINSIIQSELSSFQNVNQIVELNKTVINNKMEVQTAFNNMWGFTSVGNQVICIMVSYMTTTDIPSFILITYSLSKLNNMIINTYYFLVRYKEISNDYENYQDFLVNGNTMNVMTK